MSTVTRRAATTIMTTLLLLAVGCSDDDPAAPAPTEATGPPTTMAAAPATASNAPPTTDHIDGAETAVQESVLPFTDTFDDDSNGWGGPFQRFDSGDYLWELPAGQSDSRSPDTLIAAEDDIESVDVTTSLAVEGIDAVGLECAFEELDSSSRWYRLSIGTDGARISKQQPGFAAATILATNEDHRLTDGEHQVRVLCRPGPDGYRLVLHVDGELVVDVTDTADPFGRAGSPNLYAQAAPSPPDGPHQVRFHDITIIDPAVDS